MSDQMPPPPEAAEVDQALQELDDEVAELRFRWRWAIAGVVAIALAEAGAITAAAVTGSQDLITLPAVGGVVAFIGGGLCIAYALDNRNNRIGLDRERRRLEVERREVLAGRAKRSAAPYARYKEHLPFLAEHYKLRATRYRRIYVMLQLIVIVGSFSASAVTALITSSDTKVLPVGITLLVGVAASCSLTFRLRERGETLQQTAMDIEREYRAAELRIGDYADDADDSRRFRRLVERVELMRAEQAQKERALDQPPDLQQSSSSGIGTI